MLSVTKEFYEELNAKCEQRKREILEAEDALEITGTTYYVSNDGDDASDGLAPDRAWKTLARVTEAELQPGDGVRFRRGDLFRGFVKAKAGVGYGAYGEGEKPKLYGWDRDLCDAALWECVDEEHHIWRWGEPILDPGTLVFNHGEAHCRKLIPSFIGGQFVCRNDESKLFRMEEEMTKDLDLYWYFTDIMTEKPSKGESFPIPDMTLQSLGTVYLRCDRGNPAEVFDSIEALTRRSMIGVGSAENVRIDNLCIKYVGLHGIAAGGHVKGLHVTNCELGWIGGTIQHYYGTDPNYPQGGRGTVTRFGNAIEIYGGCEDYVVTDCYIYQVYDAGITHQVTTNGKRYVMEGIRYLRNLIEHCVYGIEYFLDMNKGDEESYMRDIRMNENIIRFSGYGWGQQRHNTDTPALIKGWSYVNRAEDYSIENNIFDRSAYRMLHLVARDASSCPVMKGNTYIQYRGGMLGQYGANGECEPEIMPYDDRTDGRVKRLMGDTEAKLYIIC